MNFQCETNRRIRTTVPINSALCTQRRPSERMDWLWPRRAVRSCCSSLKIQLLFGVTVGEVLINEGCYDNNAYLFGDLYIPSRMRQPTNSTQVIKRPGFDILLIKSLYGTRQAGKIWGMPSIENLFVSTFNEALPIHAYNISYTISTLSSCAMSSMILSSPLIDLS